VTTAPPAGTAQLSRRANALTLAVLVALAIGRTVATYSELSATGDEMQHVAAGLEWLEGGSFTAWRDQNASHLIVSPPLARLAVAAGPYLAGLRLVGLRELPYTGPGYATNLALARAGVLPFLALAIVLTWALARRALGDDRLALAAAALFSFCPPVLGHAGLATTDVPFTATALLALLLGLRWLESPTTRGAAALGAALGLAMATKLSAPVLGLAIVVAAIVKRRTTRASLPLPRRALSLQLFAAAASAMFVLFLAYRCDFGRPRAEADPAVWRELKEACFSTSAGRQAATTLASTPMPAPALFNGLVALCAQNAPGRSTSYLLGRISQDGFRLFFPVALTVKLPLALLALTAAGVLALLRRARAAAEEPADARPWRLFAIPWMAATYLATAIASRINIGVRHLLPMVPLIAIVAASGLGALTRATRRPRLAAGLAAILAVSAIAVPFLAAPDYLAWFNALAGRHPEDVLLDSDLDWGQDLRRLERALAERHVDRVSLAYFGPADLCRHDLPTGRWLRPHERVEGWIAISEMYRKGVIGFFYRDGNYCDRAQWTTEAPPDPDEYAWLDAYAPVARVGKSILLYDVPKERQ
jgi:4-amino-4-deoxy-L-arabinose transferase-like glycosyltransferase